MSRKLFLMGFMGVFTALVAWASNAAPVRAAVPNLIEYQGRLGDASGNPLGGSGGQNFNFKFSIWDAASGGNRLWPATAPTAVSLNVINGIFNAPLGDTSVGFPALNLSFNSATPYYLQIDIWNATSSAYETLNPRQPIESAGFAVNAASLNGFTQGTSSNNLLQLDAGGNINLSGGQIRPVNSASCAGLTALGGGSLCYDTTQNNLFIYNGSSSSWASFLSPPTILRTSQTRAPRGRTSAFRPAPGSRFRVRALSRIPALPLPWGAAASA